MNLSDFFRLHPKVAVAFSGGVDSAYLLYAAGQSGAQVQAYYVQSAFQPRFERRDAVRLAEELGVPLRILSVDVLAEETVPTVWGNVRKKVSEGYGVLREKYEYEDVARAARENGLSLAEVLRRMEEQEK